MSYTVQVLTILWPSVKLYSTQLLTVKCINSSNTRWFRWKCVMTNCYYWRLEEGQCWAGAVSGTGRRWSSLCPANGTYCNGWHCLARGQFKMEFYLHTSLIVITSLFTETVPLLTTVCSALASLYTYQSVSEQHTRSAGYKLNTMHCSVSGRKHRYHTQKTVKFYSTLLRRLVWTWIHRHNWCKCHIIRRQEKTQHKDSE
jgi:hypothetical protein